MGIACICVYREKAEWLSHLQRPARMTFTRGSCPRTAHPYSWAASLPGPRDLLDGCGDPVDFGMRG